MAQDCCTTNNNRMLLACSGGSNVGQLANQAVVELTQEGFGKMYCLVGIGAQLKNFVQSAKDAETIVTLDGCSLGCAKAVLEQAKIPNKNYLVLTDLSIEKNKNLALQKEDVQRIKETVKRQFG